jgi:C-terminal processing protease CtpA/Prc
VVITRVGKSVTEFKLDVLPMQVNDVILTVDGRSVESLDLEDIKFLTVGDEGSVAQLVLRRHGETRTVILQRIQGDMGVLSDSTHWNEKAKTSGFIGLVVTQQPPHAVEEIHDLVDMHGKLQGSAGYQNEQVEIGDLIMAINGEDVRNLSVDDVHGLLRGELHSCVDIMLQRKRNMAIYSVRVLRHRAHEFER